MISAVTFGEFIHLAKLKLLDSLPRDYWQAKNILIMPHGFLDDCFCRGDCWGLPAILAYPNFKADPDKYGPASRRDTESQGSLSRSGRGVSSGTVDRITMADGAQLVSSPLPSLRC
jgi:hypothetical protein